MIEEITTISMNEETVDWLTDWVKELYKREETNAKKLDSFIKTMDGMIDQLNTTSLHSVVLRNANTAANALIHQMSDELLNDDQLSDEMQKCVDDYIIAQKTAINMEHAFFSDDEQDEQDSEEE